MARAGGCEAINRTGSPCHQLSLYRGSGLCEVLVDKPLTPPLSARLPKGMNLNKRIVTLGLAALFVALTAAAYSGLADQNWLAPAAIVIAAAALLVAWQTQRRLRALEYGFANLARTLEGVLRQMQTSTDKAATTIGDLELAMKAEVSALQARIAGRAGSAAKPAPDASDPANISSFEPAQPVKTSNGRSNVVRLPRAAARGDAEIEKALAEGVLPISLQPIVSLSRSSAEAFSVFACLPDGAGYRHINTGNARFEEVLALSAIAARRRQMPGLADSVPIQVPVTAELVNVPEALQRVTEAYRLQPELTNGVWLELPVDWFADSGAAAARGRLLAAGVRFVASGWNDAADVSHLKSLGVAAIKLPASFLLDHDQPRHSGKVGRIIADTAAAGLQVIATDVATDEQAVALVDIGVDLMSGDRFAGPQRLRGASGKSRSA